MHDILGLLHNHFADHDWVDRAEIHVRSRIRKCERKLVIRVQCFGPELLVLADHGMRNIIMIYPGDRTPLFNRHFPRREAEVVYGNVGHRRLLGFPGP